MTRRKALRSIETRDGLVCVDIFRRTDGSFGFEEYRRDPEDPRDWFPVGGFADLRYETTVAAYQAATNSVTWLATLAGDAIELNDQDEHQVGTTP